MKSRNLRLITFSTLIIAIVLISVWAGCSAKKEKYGELISDLAATKVENILAKSEDYEGKTVKVEGQIVEECPSGCWFNLKGETGIIYVKISEFVIPQKVGRTAVVEGKVSNETGRLSIFGNGVEIR